MSTRHRVKFEDSSHTLSTTLDSGLGVPTTASVICKDHSGNVLLNGTIDSVTDATGGVCTFAYTGHAIAKGDVVTVAGTTSYNAEQTVIAVGTGTFNATETYVADESGTYTITAAAATVLTATTLSAAATRGKGTITLAAVTNITEGSVLRIAMSADGPEEDVTIANVNTVSKVCGLTDRLKFSHTSGAAVSGRFLSYALDVSDTDVFKSGLDFNVIWDLNTDDPAWREDAEILKREVAFGGLEAEFKAAFPHYHTEITGGGFDTMQARAFATLRNRFMQIAQRDLDKLVNPDDLEEILMWQIAYQIAWAGDNSWGEERTATKQVLDELVNRFATSTNIWIDDDQDDVEEDEEVQSMARPLPRRNLIG